MRLFQKLLSLSVVSASVLAAVVLTPACSSGSGGSGGSGPGAVSSVDSSRTAGSLSDAEAKQYCEDTVSYSKAQISEADTKKLGCGFGAAVTAGFGAKTDAEAKTKCTESYNACLAKPTATPDAGATKDPCATAKAELKDCTATIAELNTCTADQAAAFKALVGKDLCADAKAATKTDAGAASPAPSPFEQPASCKALQAKCPNLYKSDG